VPFFYILITYAIQDAKAITRCINCYIASILVTLFLLSVSYIIAKDFYTLYPSLFIPIMIHALLFLIYLFIVVYNFFANQSKLNYFLVATALTLIGSNILYAVSLVIYESIYTEVLTVLLGSLFYYFLARYLTVRNSLHSAT
jgi:hypothetical protein